MNKLTHEQAVNNVLSHRDCAFLERLLIESARSSRHRVGWYRASIGRFRLAWMVITGKFNPKAMMWPTPADMASALTRVAAEIDGEAVIADMEMPDAD